jgi:2-oxoglutarate dehydrogenase E2 component (dihydrolipoamide succinyltransferase)
MTVKLPRVADTVDEVIVSQWLVGVGSPVEAGAGLMLVETDKAMVEVPSPVSGTLVEALVEVNEEIRTGARLAVVDS